MRIPKGVRVDGRGVGGRFVDAARAFALFDRADDTESRAALYAMLLRAAKRDPEARVYSQMLTSLVKPRRPRKKAAKKAVKKAAKKVAKKAAKKSKSTRPPVPPMRPPEPPQVSPPGIPPDLAGVEDYDVMDDMGAMSPEWEINFDYLARKENSVQVTIRFRRKDGRNMAWAEAVRRFTELLDALDSKQLPEWPHHVVAGVDWQRPHWGSERFGDASDLFGFINPMYTRLDDAGAWRLAAVDVDDTTPF